jgi:hypothetical protein
MRVAELKIFVEQNGLLSYFNVYEVDSDNKPILSTSRNLLHDYGTITLDQVNASTKGMQGWADDHKVWAETITTQLVSNSCDSELRERVTERLMDVDDFKTGGTTYFKLCIDSITSMSHTVSMSLSIRVSKMTIKQFNGTFLRGATQRLNMSNMLPPPTCH